MPEISDNNKTDNIAVDCLDDHDSNNIDDDTSSISVKKPKQLLEDTFDIAPVGLTFCFDRLQFLNTNFEADAFILEYYSQGIKLERLRDDLLQYSNILKSSLIELINQDYADFVSLSTNLVGLDKMIDGVADPLKHLQSTIRATTTYLETTIDDITIKLKALQQLQNKRDLVHSLHILDVCVLRLERWLSAPVNQSQSDGTNNNTKNVTSCDDTQFDRLDEWPPDLYADSSLHEDIGQRMDRIANEYIKLQFYTKKYKDHPIMQSLKPRIHEITLKLQKQLETRLKECLDACCLINTPNNPIISKRASEQLRHVLSIYLAIDKLPDLLLLYRSLVLRPSFSKLFAPQPELTHASSSTSRSAELLQTIYDEALKILDSQLNLINSHVLQHVTAESSDPLSEFDCLVGAFWPETVDLICSNLSEIFSPGDPDRFYALYITSQKYVASVQSRTVTKKQLLALQNHPAFTMFANKWSLPVYFQIRLQEIASIVEDTIKLGIVPTNRNGGSCLLEITETVIKQLNRCWSDGVYLDKVKHRFWKLSLQILSRYASFVQHEINRLRTKCEISNNDAAELTNLPTAQLKPSTNVEFPLSLIYLLVDCFQLTDYVRSTLMNNVFNRISTTTNIDQNILQTCQTQLLHSIDESCERILSLVGPVQQIIVNLIQSACVSSIHQVLDVPRQYRRTNREFPNCPSVYVSHMIKPLNKLTETGSDLAEFVPSAKSSLLGLTRQCIIKITQAFTTQVNEVLTSVRKMEDSLRRLHEVRRGCQNSIQASITSGLHSDDDEKIYRQLYLDAHEYFDKVNSLWSIDEQCLAELERCIDLTDSSKNKQDSVTTESEITTS